MFPLSAGQSGQAHGKEVRREAEYQVVVKAIKKQNPTSRVIEEGTHEESQRLGNAHWEEEKLCVVANRIEKSCSQGQRDQMSLLSHHRSRDKGEVEKGGGHGDPRKDTLAPSQLLSVPRFLNAIVTFIKATQLTDDMKAKEIPGESVKRKWKSSRRTCIWTFSFEGKETSKSSGQGH